ncbi:zinc finger protein 250-like isoform X2 [Dermacentor albipictus]|uniref:zinc finger protein 250-like isoform X2 n=1 Tax=Dermacentor albipictus TaxID=60249 RepID=UPI0038FCC13E
MAEERNNENTPPAFTFGDEATPRTSQEFFEGPSCTSDCCTTTSDDFFEDLWNAFKSLSYSEDVTGHTHVTESGISNSPPMASSSSSSHPQPSTSHAGTEEISAIPENIASIADEAWKYQWNTQPTPITGGTCNIDGVTDNGSTSYQHLGSTSSIDNARPSTSLAGMEEASASFEDYATICDDSFEDQWILFDSLNDSKDGTGHTHVSESGITSSPFMASSSSVYPAQPSTSRAGMEEASAVPENIARNAPWTGGTEQRELCGACGNVSSRADALHGHAKEPTNDTAQICNACDQSPVKMSKSVEHFHNLTGKKHKCEACGKQFRWASDLAKHQLTHTDERRYKCEICEKMFRQAGHLRNHRRTHTDEKPYLCITCGRTYKCSSDLRKHERTHAGANRHTCQKCAKSFENNYNLKRHVGTQCGNSAFICDICDRFFMRNSDLLRHHRKKHADETPYECTHCGCRFADQETRDRHVCQKERRM